MNESVSDNDRQVTVAGVMGYTAVCGLCFGMFRYAYVSTQGIHTIFDAQLASILRPIAMGLLFLIIGLPIAVVVKGVRQAVPISFGCFFVGLMAIPVLYITLMTLFYFDLIDFD